MSYTPPPWTIGDDGESIFGPEGMLVARVHGGGPGQLAVKPYNAALISTAPDLVIELVGTCMALCRLHDAYCERTKRPEPVGFVLAQLALADLAVRKARAEHLNPQTPKGTK